jgi:hypothetical protein
MHMSMHSLYACQTSKPDNSRFGEQDDTPRVQNRLLLTPQFNDSRDWSLKAIDNAVWSYGEWGGTLQGEAGPVFVKGYFSAIYVREGDDWKMRTLILTEHPTTCPACRDEIDVRGEPPEQTIAS